MKGHACKFIGSDEIRYTLIKMFGNNKLPIDDDGYKPEKRINEEEVDNLITSNKMRIGFEAYVNAYSLFLKKERVEKIYDISQKIFKLLMTAPNEKEEEKLFDYITHCYVENQMIDPKGLIQNHVFELITTQLTKKEYKYCLDMIGFIYTQVRFEE